MRIWRMNIWRTTSTIISWAGSFVCKKYQIYSCSTANMPDVGHSVYLYSSVRFHYTKTFQIYSLNSWTLSRLPLWISHLQSQYLQDHRIAWSFIIWAMPSTQSDQHLCCSLPRSYNTSSFYIQNFKPLPNFCGCAGWFESTLVANPEDRFSHVVAHLIPLYVLHC